MGSLQHTLAHTGPHTRQALLTGLRPTWQEGRSHLRTLIKVRRVPAKLKQEAVQPARWTTLRRKGRAGNRQEPTSITQGSEECAKGHQGAGAAHLPPCPPSSSRAWHIPRGRIGCPLSCFLPQRHGFSQVLCPSDQRLETNHSWEDGLLLTSAATPKTTLLCYRTVTSFPPSSPNSPPHSQKYQPKSYHHFESEKYLLITTCLLH